MFVSLRYGRIAVLVASLALSACGGFSNDKDKNKPAEPPAIPEGKKPVVAATAEHVFGKQAQIGDLLITVGRPVVNTVSGQHYNQFSSMRVTLVGLEVKNNSPGKVAEWAGWQKTAILKDEHENKFEPIDLKGWRNLPGNSYEPTAIDSGTRIHPGKTHKSLLYLQEVPKTSKIFALFVSVNKTPLAFKTPAD